MARPTKAEANRKKTEEAILLTLQKNETTAQYYLDKVNEYMEFYDSFQLIIEELNTIKEKGKIDSVDKFSQLMKEKRLASKEMRAILTYLNITPITVGDDEDEDTEL